MSVICRTFVQNAWRSDLCSNCFKSLEDHSDSGGSTRRNNVCEKLSVPRYVPQAATLYQSRGISTSLKWRLNESLYDRVTSRRDIASQTPSSARNRAGESPPADLVVDGGNRGILIRNEAAPGEKRSKSRPSVDFASEEALVIGYGGNDYDSDTSPWEMGSDDGSIDLDLLDDTDEDRKITKLTKNNTEFNSLNRNLTTAEDSTRKAKREEEKLNTINNTINNNNNHNHNVGISTKSADKTISILTYNDIQSTKTAEKKLNQYFFPSSTDIKSYLNGRGTSLIIEEAVVKNNNNNEKLTQAMTGSVKVQNCTRRAVQENGTRKVTLEEDFTPLNTRTYSFVSELNKSNSVSFEQSSDSDYSTCRHTTGDSTDSESFHDVEESRLLPKSSFLHGTYTISPPAMHESDIDKKYDAGSSTSGDVSNFSDDSDTHDTAPYEPRSTRVPEVKPTPAGQNNRQEERSSRVHRREEEEEEGPDSQKPVGEIPKASDAKQQNQSPKSGNQKSRQSPPISSKHDGSLSTDRDAKNARSQAEDASPPKDSSQKADRHRAEARKAVTKSASLPNIPPSSDEAKKSPVSKDKGLPEKQRPVPPPAVPQPISETEHQQRTPTSRDAPPTERNDGSPNHYDDTSDYDKSPDVIVNRQSKLAALALELEMARRDSEARAKKPTSPPSATAVTPPEVKMRHSVSGTPTNTTDNYPTIKKASAISCASRLSTLPDVLQETPAKQKKTKFSLKKLLKRNKDSGTFSPANKEVNPKAWKKQTFDRNRLSLEIVHPMDLTSDVPTSADSTPTEEHRQIVSTHPGKFTFKGVSSRARSLSALPQLSGDDQSGCALLECRKMDTVPTRKAGTVAERKKNRPSLVRTPSCSALPNRSTSTPTSSDRTPPPKPPPPPKCKVMHPPPPLPPPHSHPRCSKPNNATPSPARPPPPKIPDAKSRSHSSGSSAQELHEQNHSDKEYANLGDIRSLMTPKKPQRPSAFPSASPGRGGAMRKGSEDIYETLPADEEDHYTYLDEAEAKASNKATEVRGIESPPKGKPEPPQCGRPWLDLQTSYAAIAAANYESLAELITTSLNESAEYFRRVEQSLKWRDFVLESDDLQPQHYQHLIKEKAVYSATYKSESEEKVTLVVAPRKQTTPQNARNQTRYPVLASFNDPIPKSLITNDNYILQESEMASIYILQRSRVTTVSNFAEASSADLANQYIHLRNYCFVLLQLIHTLKSLQAEGIEEINYDLQILVLVVTDEDRPPILVLFPEDKVQLTLCDISSRKTLCQATLETMLHFLQIGSIDDLKTCLVNGEQLADPVAHTFKAIAKVLSEEKASSLSQAKGFLEYMLWGPVDVKISQTDSEDVLDTILQRWLDLQRAQMVKSTISHLQNKKGLQVSPHVYEEYQLIFLLQASVKSLKNVVSKL